MFLAHAPISYLANESIQKEKISTLKNSQQIFIAVLSLIFGILPDFDFLILMMFDRPSYTHHDFFTHTLFYWTALWLILLLLSKLIYPHLNRKTKQFLTEDFLKIILNAFLIAGLSHFLADLLVGNIMLLFPFSDKHFTLFRYLFEPSYFTGYLRSVYFAIEVLIVGIFLWMFSRKFLKKHKRENFVAYILLGISVIYIFFTVFMNIQTYNNSFWSNSYKPAIDYDKDFDTLRDIEDWDLDNDGVDNITQADYQEVISNVESIIDSNKLAVGEEENILDKVYLRYGALNSYRLISQAFFEANSPIEPVLKDHYLKSLDNKRYTVSFDHVEMLKDFFESKDMLIELNYKAKPLLAPGKIFFLLDDKGEIMNVGITLLDNNVGIVLPGERYVQRHSLDGILLFYGDTISTFQIVQ
ncbi:MAG: seg [candidate division WS6 bacterium 34_10]|uniref:Seg n=1 Tax=candidate division WS6 bacterium 34_10 TaxID=1641389 RepID=A0A101HG48_9BACT|nr:MAG: seg [candidate division WS6 bacterium 34_10]